MQKAYCNQNFAVLNFFSLAIRSPYHHHLPQCTTSAERQVNLRMLFRMYSNSSSITKFKLVQEATLGVLIEEVHSVHVETDGDLFTGSGGGSGRNASGESTLFTNGEVEVNFCTHKLGNINVTLNSCALAHLK